MKRILSLFLAFVFVVGICASAPITANAASVSDLTFELNEAGTMYKVTDCNYNASGEIVIPSTYNGLPVTLIGSSAFEGCKKLVNITIPNGVTSIGDYAFRFCNSLTSITIGNGVTSIGSFAFYDCTSLTSITIPDSVTSIGNYAFYDCTSLTSITIPDSVTSIGGSAFCICTSLTSVTIPDSVTSIGYGAFEYCSSLTSITIPDSVTSIGGDAFYYCTSLTSITIPDSVTSIGVGAFCECSSLASITIPDSVTSIGGSAFEECTSLTSVTIGNSVTSIGGSAFEECTSLTSITIPDSVTSIGDNAFYGCSSLTSVTIPASVTRIGDEAFGYAYDAWAEREYKVEGFTIYGVCGTEAYEYAKDNEFKFVPTDHSYSSKVTKQPTCTETGLKTFTCSCGDSYTEELPATGHTEKTIWAKAATCTETGLTEGKKCSVCDIILAEQEIIPATGHTEEIIYATEPTCTETGLTEGVKCSVCDTVLVEQELTPALGHNYSNEYTVDKAPTYDEEGSESRHCTRCGAKTDVRAIPKLVRLSAPTVLTTESTENGVKFTWSAVEGADGYTVFKLTQDATGNYVYKELATVGKATLAFTDKTAVDGEIYCYAVCAMDNYGATSPYAEFAFTYVKPLSTPVAKTANTAKGIKVSWNKVDNAQKYVVYQRSYNAKTKTWSNWKALKSTTGLSFVDTTTKLGTIYRYTVKAVNGSNVSGIKSTSNIKFDVKPTVSVANASNGIKVSWSTVANATGYTVYSSTYNAKTKKWSGWKNRGTTKANAKSWVDKSAKAGTIYKYTVRARYGSVASSFVASANIVRLLNPTVKAVKASNGVKVTWNKIAGAKNYKIYRATYTNGKWSGWSGIATTNNKTFAYVDKTAKKGVYYKYTVRAVNGKSASSFTASKNVKR